MKDLKDQSIRRTKPPQAKETRQSKPIKRTIYPSKAKPKKSIFDGRIACNARRSVEEREAKANENKSKYYDEAYGKKNEFEWKHPDEISKDKFFHMPKITTKSHVPLNAVAIYPVLCSLADFEKNKWFQVPQDTLSNLSGMNRATVQKGIDFWVDGGYALEDKNMKVVFIEQKKVTKGTRHLYNYRAGFIREDLPNYKEWQKESIVFYTCIIESGAWSALSQRAKALYIGLRSYSNFDLDRHVDDSHEYSGLTPYEANENKAEIYINRTYETYDKSLSQLCKQIGISDSHINKVFDELKNAKLVKRSSHYSIDNITKVYLKPYNE